MVPDPDQVAVGPAQAQRPAGETVEQFELPPQADGLGQPGFQGEPGLGQGAEELGVGGAVLLQDREPVRAAPPQCAVQQGEHGLQEEEPPLCPAPAAAELVEGRPVPPQALQPGQLPPHPGGGALRDRDGIQLSDEGPEHIGVGAEEPGVVPAGLPVPAGDLGHGPLQSLQQQGPVAGGEEGAAGELSGGEGGLPVRELPEEKPEPVLGLVDGPAGGGRRRPQSQQGGKAERALLAQGGLGPGRRGGGPAQDQLLVELDGRAQLLQVGGQGGAPSLLGAGAQQVVQHVGPVFLRELGQVADGGPIRLRPLCLELPEGPGPVFGGQPEYALIGMHRGWAQALPVHQQTPEIRLGALALSHGAPSFSRRAGKPLFWKELQRIPIAPIIARRAAACKRRETIPLCGGKRRKT